MSTLSTFAKYAAFAGLKSRPELPGAMERTKATLASALPIRGAAGKEHASRLGKLLSEADSEDASKAYKAVKKTKMRNLLVGGGLGLGAVGVLGGVAYANRKRSQRRAEMGYGNLSSFASPKLSDYTPDPKDYKNRPDLSDLKSREYRTNVLNKDGVAVRGALTLDSSGNPTGGRAVTQKSFKGTEKITDKDTLGKLKKMRGQKALEKSTDGGGDLYKGAKGGEYISRTLAAAGSPERALIAAGKKSENGFVRGISKGADKAGYLGYKAGATGLRGVANKAVGRTLTGKAVRGVGVIGTLGAIGAAMKKKNNEV